jgi:drug/metabolite transporter (DMT)-like permease
MPVATGTYILLFAFWCRFFRGERLSRGGWLAVALGIAGIALLSLKP